MKELEKKKVHLPDVQQHTSLLPHWSSKVGAELPSREHMEQRGEVEQMVYDEGFRMGQKSHST